MGKDLSEDRVSMKWRSAALFLGVMHVLSSLGCSSSSRNLVALYEPQRAADEALKLYDTNGDDQIDAAELEKCPALQSAMSRVDTNGDKVISADELAARIGMYQEQSTLVGTQVLVNSRRKPVANASVVFEYEPFMGNERPRFSGTTGSHGIAPLVDERTGSPSEGLLPVGFYRVQITPAGRGAAEIVRGCEIADDAGSATQLVLSLD